MRLLNTPKLITGEVVAITWEHIEESVDVLEKYIGRLEEFDTILALVRGGLVPSILLSHRLGKRGMIFLQGIKTSSDKPHDYGTYYAKILPNIHRGEKVIIVDDIIFEGDTVNSAIEHIHNSGGSVVCICAIVADEHFLLSPSKFSWDNIPFIISYKCQHRGWIRFPWEQKIKEEKVAIIK